MFYKFSFWVKQKLIRPSFLFYSSLIHLSSLILQIEIAVWLKHSMHNSFLSFGAGTWVTISFPQTEHDAMVFSPHLGLKNASMGKA